MGVRPWVASLQSLRGLAALAVVLFHLDSLVHTAGGTPRLGFVGAYGWLGVDLFFVLSAYLLGPRFAAPQPPRAGRFWLERFARIAPAYYAACLVAAVVLFLWFRSGWAPAIAWTNLVFAQNFRAETWGSLNIVFWTLAVEVQFYLVLPWMGRLFASRRWAWWTLLFVGASIAFRAATFGHGDGNYLGTQDRLIFLGTYTLPAFVGHFALGLAATRLPPIRWPGPAAVAGLALVALLGWLLAPTHWTVVGVPSWSEHVLYRTLAAVGFAILVAACSTEGLPQRILGWRPLVALGDMSYSLYLVHFSAIAALYANLDAATRTWTFIGTGFVLALTAGGLLFFLVEHPAERVRTAWLKKTRPATTVTHFP